MATDELIEEQVNRFRDTWAAIEAMVQQAEADGTDLTGDCLLLMSSVGLTDTAEIDRYRTRTANAQKWKITAGTVDERADLEQEIASAKAKRDAELPGLQQELKTTVERLQRKIDVLNDKVDRPQADLDRRNEAVEHLRSERVLPPHVNTRYRAAVADARKQFHDVQQAHSNIKTHEGRMELIKHLEQRKSMRLDVPNDNQQTGLDELRSFARSQNLGTSDGNTHQLDPAKVAALKAETEQKIAEARQIIEERGHLREAALNDAEDLRNYYIE